MRYANLAPCLYDGAGGEYDNLALALPILVAGGLKSVAFPLQQSHYMESPTANNYENVDAYLSVILPSGVEEIVFVHGYGPPMNTAWKALNGGVAWPVPAVPPLALHASMRARLQAAIQHVDGLCAAAGVRVKHAYMRECGVGGNLIPEPYKGELIRLGHEGVWWTTQDMAGWVAEADGGLDDLDGQIGLHEFFDSVYLPVMSATSNPWCFPAYECQSIELLETELETSMAPGYAWYDQSLYSVVGFDCYEGTVTSRKQNVEVCTDAAIAKARTARDMIREVWPDIDICIWEWGFSETALTDAKLRPASERFRGECIVHLADRYASIGLPAYFFVVNGDSGTDPYALIKSTGAWMGCSAQVLARGGYIESVAPDSSAWVGATGESSSTISATGARP